MAKENRFPSSEVTKLDQEIDRHIARAVSGEPKAKSDAARIVGDLAAQRVKLTSPPAFRRIHQALGKKAKIAS